MDSRSINFRGIAGSAGNIMQVRLLSHFSNRIPARPRPSESLLGL
jgi:hypothetical protein